MSFISSAMSTLEIIVIALGAGLAVWGGVNLIEGYGGTTQQQMRRAHKEANIKCENSETANRRIMYKVYFEVKPFDKSKT